MFAIKKIIKLAPLIFNLIIPINKAQACSVFARENKAEQFVVGKNFDWLPSKGYLIENPAGLKRSSLTPGKKNWVSHNRSISFTTMGPGFPISSMNELGLTVEALVDLDAQISKVPKNDLISLEWAQYIIDNFESLEQVITFAESNSFDQLIEPVHFFICDIAKNCAVFETTESGIHITSKELLREPVLANRSWAKDYLEMTPSSLHSLANLNLNPYSSDKRYQRLVETSKISALSSPKEIFSVLNQSKISPIIQWQIIWYPKSQEVYWREFHLGQPKVSQNLKIGLTTECSPNSKYHELDNPSQIKNYTAQDAESVALHIETMMLWRGKKVDPNLAQQIALHTLHLTCLKSDLDHKEVSFAKGKIF